MDSRQFKALEIAARMRVEFKDGCWWVPSSSGKGIYQITLSADGNRCTCPDHELTAKDCKHIYAAQFVSERNYGTNVLLLDPAPPERKTYKQNWPVYNEAQLTEKKRFLKLLSGLCDGINEPPQPKTGRRRTLMRDMVFAAVFKVYSTVSSRRFGTDLDDAHEKGYLTKRINSMSTCAYLESDLMTPILESLITHSAGPLRAVDVDFAIDSTGFTTSRFHKWFDHKYGQLRQEHDWVKAHFATGVKTNVVTAVRILDRDAADSPQFVPLTQQTAANFTIREMSGDKAYSSRDNLAAIEALGGTAYIPFKVNASTEAGGLWEKMLSYYLFRRDEFLAHYHKRSNAESTVSMVKAKFRDHVRSKTDTAMKNEVLAKFIAHNICCVIMSQGELGIEPVFWPELQTEDQEVIPMWGRRKV